MEDPLQKMKLTTPVIHQEKLPSTTQRNCHHPELLPFSNGLLSKTIPPNFLLVHKIMLFFCLLGVPRVLLSSQSQIAIFYIPNKSIFADKITDLFLKLRIP